MATEPEQPHLELDPAKDLSDLFTVLWNTKGMTLRQLAYRSNLSSSFISEVIHGKKVPSPQSAWHLARAFKADKAIIDKVIEYAENYAELRRVQRGARSPRTLLEPAVDAIIAACLARNGAGGSYRPAIATRQALEVAAGRTITRYAAHDGRLELAKPLLSGPVLLSEPTVAAQFAHAVMRDAEPDRDVIGNRWQAALRDSPQPRDFAAESAALLEYFAAEIDAPEVAPWLDELRAPRPDPTPMKADEVLSQSLAQSRRDLASTRKLLGKLPVGVLPPGLRIYRYDQTPIFVKYTAEFVGRRALLDQINGVIESRDRAYCHVLAEPGVGKTALAANLVLDKKYIHHFNSRADGIVKPPEFLGNVCARLIAAYDLDYVSLPSRALDNAGYLTELLAEVAGRAGRDKVVIVVDALDEADALSQLPGMNPLCLPSTVPQGVIFLVTSRPRGGQDAAMRPPRITADCEQVTIAVDHLGEENMADIRAYLRSWPSRKGVAEYMARWRYSVDDFVGKLAERSEGNFMYTKQVLLAIQSGEVRDRELDTLPQGLNSYYADHLERMRERDEEAWFGYRLPVLTAFVVLRSGPVTADAIAALSGIDDIARIKATLRDWRAFIEPVPEFDRGVPHQAYRIYHASFEDFLRGELN